MYFIAQSNLTLPKSEQFLFIAILIFCVFLVISYFYNRFLQQKFEAQYQVKLPKGSVIHFSLLAFLQKNDNNHYLLKIPYWTYPKKDGTKDNRYRNNHYVLPYSILYIGPYQIKHKNPITLLTFVHLLRSHSIEIKKNTFELMKEQQLRQANDLQQSIHSLQEIQARFAENPVEFETYCANLFQTNGYQGLSVEAKTTKATNDGGYDVFLRFSDGTTGIMECKCYAEHNTVSRPLVQKLVGANQVVHADKLFFVTTSSFSNGALEYARLCDVECIDGLQLIQIQQNQLRQLELENTSPTTMYQMTIAELKQKIPADILPHLI